MVSGEVEECAGLCVADTRALLRRACIYSTRSGTSRQIRASSKEGVLGIYMSSNI